MNRHDVRRWLGGRSLRSFATEAELCEQFESKNLVRLFGTQYTFEDMRKARATALKMWREIHVPGGTYER
jgi:hypothetical protein